MEARPRPPNNFSRGVGGKLVSMNTFPKVPKMSFSNALGTRSLSNSIILLNKLSIKTPAQCTYS